MMREKLEGKAPIHHINHSFGVRVALVGGVRGSVVDHGLVNGVPTYHKQKYA